ncbi:uncharacterized protein ACA1_104790 [Acanthamoeba castellanii str. Neff]|uniref:Uncharacterized protein n=1 Tax=Acanthamoeba castellanii (strain ATCC 30010 / Neff) TaxID=1257118 RepID=L8GWI7_ACACF|nr:uncharacterized protein ACA1_104790 [Acanthamoeba castellanii str. Neff]ELR16456.1 hypothetical protein ACA1_104790 [Acanthamoeba castellanii str. Neff]
MPICPPEPIRSGRGWPRPSGKKVLKAIKFNSKTGDEDAEFASLDPVNKVVLHLGRARSRLATDANATAEQIARYRKLQAGSGLSTAVTWAPSCLAEDSAEESAAGPKMKLRERSSPKLGDDAEALSCGCSIDEEEDEVGEEGVEALLLEESYQLLVFQSLGCRAGWAAQPLAWLATGVKSSFLEFLPSGGFGRKV